MSTIEMSTKAEIIDRSYSRPSKPRPMKLICLNGRIIAEAVVIVGEKDPNWWREAKAVLTNGVVTVKLPRRI